MDFSQLSDAELERLAAGEETSNPQPQDVSQSLSQMSDAELEKLASGEVDEASFLESIGQSALDGLIYVGNKIDSYTGAPTRAAIGAVQDGENPIMAFGAQFGEDPGLAPAGKDIAIKAGARDEDVVGKTAYSAKEGFGGDPTITNPATELGVAIDVGADPLNLLGIGAVTKGIKGGAQLAGRGAKATASMTGELATRGARAIPGVGTTVDIAKGSAKSTAQALKKMFKPVQAGDFKELKSVAQKHGIDPQILPESIEFGQDSFISRAARNRAEGVLGEEHLKRFNDAYDAVQEATENTVRRIGGGSVPDAVEAGSAIRKGYNDAVEELFKTVDFTYNEVLRQVPGIRLTDDSLARLNAKLSGLEKFAKGRAKRGITNTDRGQAKQILNAIQSVRAGNGSLKQIFEAMQDIGRHSFKAQNSLADIPVDIEKFRDLYFTLRKEFIETTGKHLGKDIADQLIDNNQILTNFMTDKAKIASLVGNKRLSPEKLFNSLIVNGDVQKIEALKSLLPPESFQQLKGAFLASQIRKNADDAFSFKALHNSLRNKKSIVGVLLEPAEIEELGEIIRLGSRFGEPILSTSGTGASRLFGNIREGIRSGVESDVVIEKLKESARTRAPQPQKLSSPKPGQPTKALNAAQSADADFKKLAAISPAAARTLGIQSRERDDLKPVNLKGRDKWIVRGFSKILDHDKSGFLMDKKRVDAAFASKKVKSLLVIASDLKPGSRAMEKTFSQIKEILDKGGN